MHFPPKEDDARSTRADETNPMSFNGRTRVFEARYLRSSRSVGAISLGVVPDAFCSGPLSALQQHNYSGTGAGPVLNREAIWHAS
jgi:hypothetical protein